ncbi:MAG TPA: hypothetical protein DER56_06830, partial [Thermosipho africanus]|nr:hypothetical protein [Thermosipho africanus]
MKSKGNCEASNAPQIIRFNKNWYFDDLIDGENIKILPAYKKANSFLRVLRKLHLEYSIPFKNIWFNEGEIKEINNETIIVFDSVVNEEFIKYLKRIHPKKRIIFWYWNPVRNSVDPSKLTSDLCEKWSYSLVDCKKYNFKYNTTFYFKELVVPKTKPVYDIFFIGKDKGRLKELLDLKNKFENLDLKVNFHITPKKRYMMKIDSIYRNSITYDEVLTKIGKSKAILDILSNPNDGLSLRPMESMFHRKKLITNSLLISNYDFYRSQNIFILGEDDLNKL